MQNRSSNTEFSKVSSEFHLTGFTEQSHSKIYVVLLVVNSLRSLAPDSDHSLAYHVKVQSGNTKNMNYRINTYCTLIYCLERKWMDSLSFVVQFDEHTPRQEVTRKIQEIRVVEEDKKFAQFSRHFDIFNWQSQALEFLYLLIITIFLFCFRLDRFKTQRDSNVSSLFGILPWFFHRFRPWQLQVCTKRRHFTVHASNDTPTTKYSLFIFSGPYEPEKIPSLYKMM